MSEIEAPTLAGDKACVIHAVLHHTPGDATVSYAYRQRADALTAARNAAEMHAAELRRADSAFLRSAVAPDSYDIIVEDYRSWAIVSLRHRLTGEPGSAWRWIIQQHEVVETLRRADTEPMPRAGARIGADFVTELARSRT
jgi:hypothetical protein